MPVNSLDPALDRREQILRAAMICFARRGFHQTSMHDISARPGSAWGSSTDTSRTRTPSFPRWRTNTSAKSTRCWNGPGWPQALLEAFEIIFTWDCCENTPQVVSAFVVDLFAEAGRNPGVADLVRDVARTAMEGVTDLIARSPEANHLPYGLQPREIAEMIFAVNDGMLMRDVLTPKSNQRGTQGTPDAIRAKPLEPAL